METYIEYLKYLFRFGAILAILLTVQCKKDDPLPVITDEGTAPIEESEAPNTEPSAPLLTLPTNEQELVPLNSMLTWQAASDLESDALSYKVYLGRDGAALTPIAEDITTTDHVLETPLEKGETYQWRVEAIDDKGASKSSETFSFTTEHSSVTPITENASFSKRKNAALVSFKGKLLLIGGENETGETLAEIWSSADGISWEMVTRDAAFGPIKDQAIVEFQDKLWMYSGSTGSYLNKDIWSSTDGINWIQEENDTVWNTTPFLGQGQVTMFVHDGKIWRFAAYDGSTGELTTERNVWSSEDGKNWVLVKEDHGFYRKYGMKIIAFKGQLLALEEHRSDGNKISTIRKSTNALDWTIITQNPPFRIGLYSDAAVLNDRLYVTGGLGYTELWFTDDGTSWQKAVHQRGYPVKSGNTSVTHNDAVFIIGGNLNQTANDIWRID